MESDNKVNGVLIDGVYDINSPELDLTYSKV